MTLTEIAQELIDSTDEDRERLDEEILRVRAKRHQRMTVQNARSLVEPNKVIRAVVSAYVAEYGAEIAEDEECTEALILALTEALLDA